MGISRGVKKRCGDCKRTITGTPGKKEWCDCGGELTAIVYRRPGARIRRG